MRGYVVLSALVALGAGGLQAQQPAPRREQGARRGPGVEAIMSMRERLELTDDQVARLDAIREEAVQRRSAEQAEMAQMRSRLQAGQIERSEMMAFLEERRDARAQVQDGYRERVEGILTEDQLTRVREMRIRAEAFRRGRESARRGPGARDRGFGPGRGFDRPGTPRAGRRDRPGGRGPGDGSRGFGPEGRGPGPNGNGVGPR